RYPPLRIRAIDANQTSTSQVITSPAVAPIQDLPPPGDDSISLPGVDHADLSAPGRRAFQDLPLPPRIDARSEKVPRALILSPSQVTSGIEGKHEFLPPEVGHEAVVRPHELADGLRGAGTVVRQDRAAIDVRVLDDQVVVRGHEAVIALQFL